MGKKDRKSSGTANEIAQDYIINPNTGNKKVDTADWPILLKVAPRTLIF